MKIPIEIKKIIGDKAFNIDTVGLLLITDDGELGHRLLSPKKHVDKKYYVEVNGS